MWRRCNQESSLPQLDFQAPEDKGRWHAGRDMVMPAGELPDLVWSIPTSVLVILKVLPDRSGGFTAVLNRSFQT